VNLGLFRLWRLTCESIVQAYDDAIADQDFQEAIRLRDDGGAGLRGWWVAQSETDPAGHLLHIIEDFGRYTGVMYKADDLAKIKVGSALLKD
jgi:phage gp46-like protein